MADEKFETGRDELDAVADQAEQLTDDVVAEADAAVETVAEAAETVAEAAETVADEAAVVVEDAADEAAEVAEVADERVEAAVRHVAEEAQAELSPAEDAAPKKKRERRSKQARAAKEEKSDAGEAAAKTPAKVGGLAGLGVPAWIAISAACLALGLVIGRFALGGGSAAQQAGLTGASVVAEDQLDSPFATYTYNGEEKVITVREVIEQTSTLDQAKDEDGNYTLPSAEYGITVARNQILLAEVESRGIKVSEKDAKAYAEENLGTSDYEALGSTYGMDAETVQKLVEENCRVNALREEVIGSEAPAMPEAPQAAEEGAEDKATKEYAKYIIDLAGDEWDAKADDWASKDGRYATALADYKISKKGATYEAAEAAYYLAYQIYSEQQTEINEKWTEFYNGLMSNASIQVGTLVS